jgi:hypothetical protein
MTRSQQDPVQPLSFLLTLGDIVDGYGDAASYSTAAKTDKDLKQVVGLISSGLLGVPARHVLGNHCLAAPRSRLLEVRYLLAGTLAKIIFRNSETIELTRGSAACCMGVERLEADV